MPFIRLRRTRRNPQIRDLVAQTQLKVEDLVVPYFVIEGKNKKEPISSMPGIYRFSLDELINDLEEAVSLGIKAVLLFGVPGKKDSVGSVSYSDSGVVQKAIRQIRKEIRDIVIISDVCLCAYTAHGHCGLIKKSKARHPHIADRQKKSKSRAALDDFYIDNDETLKILAEIALSHARAGSDFVAPSAMMDGQVRTIRGALDNNGFQSTGILSYSAKYASGFYGPFREALDSRPRFQDRKAYQMDYRNSDEALREIEQDIDEGADIVMVKPALSYLDIIYRAKQKFNVPVAAYNVSGEYSMVKLAGQKGIINEKEIIIEILTSIKRAGADIIITYFGKEVGKWLR